MLQSCWLSELPASVWALDTQATGCRGSTSPQEHRGESESIVQGHVPGPPIGPDAL